MEDLSTIVFTVGKYTGKTMIEVLKIDSTQKYQYAFWVKDQMSKNLMKVTPSQETYLKYATQEGVFE